MLSSGPAKIHLIKLFAMLANSIVCTEHRIQAHRISRYQCSQVFITLSDGLGVNNMRCTNRRSSRTLKTAVLMVCLALVMLLLLCSGCRFFHTKKEVSQLSRRTNLIQKYRAREKKTTTHDQRKEKKKSNAQADSMLFIVSFLYILFCFARHLCCLFFVYVVFRVFFSFGTYSV